MPVPKQKDTSIAASYVARLAPGFLKTIIYLGGRPSFKKKKEPPVIDFPFW